FVADPLLKIRDQSLLNNSREDATDAWSLIWAVDRHTYESFNRLRNFLGTRSFEDWSQWHVDRMNHLFDVSPTPWDKPVGSRQSAGFVGANNSGSERPRLTKASAPELFAPTTAVRRPTTPRPRVRCDGIVVVDNVEGAWDRVLGP